MNDDEPLFGTNQRHAHGRVRKGLDAEIKKNADAGLSTAMIALLRSMADQLDQLERQLRSTYVKPYDRVPFAGLAKEFGILKEQTFAAIERAEDPLTRALAEFTARDRDAQAGDAARSDAPDGR